MAKGSRRQSREPEPKPADEIPFGYLPTADPPRRSVWLLAIAGVLLALWMLVLAYLAWWG